ncbi:MAG: hypothetical protein FWC23_07875 [Chitinispirillia bacterium]|nr:hypothetical protein [Chitinispirillia bacterium]MCL2269089.1 hypothetical protein [Chitinispirillia bacterium]
MNIRQIAAFLTAAVCMAAPAYADAPADDGVDESAPSVYGGMAAEVLVSPRSAALSSSDLALNAAGPIASNPALAARCAAPELTLSYSSYYGDVFSTSVLNYTSKVGGSGGISATAAYLLVPGIEDTRGVDIGALDPNDIKVFSVSDLWARVAYGHSFETEFAGLYAGAAVTARRRSLGPKTSAYGMGADLGAMAHFRKPSIYAGLLLENVHHSAVNWQNSGYSEKVPQHLRASLAYEREDPYIYGRISLFYTTPDLLSNEGVNAYGQTLDIEEEREPEERGGISVLFSAGRYGIEYTIMNTLSLRAGLNGAGYSMGAGLNLFGGRGGVDFCYLNHELAGTVMMSVTYRWM